MITCTRSITRPSTDVKWHFEPGVIPDASFYRFYFIEHYKDTGKCLSDSTVISEDGLTCDWSAFWISQEEYDICDADSVMNEFWTARNAYYAGVGVTQGPLVIT